MCDFVISVVQIESFPGAAALWAEGMPQSPQLAQFQLASQRLTDITDPCWDIAAAIVASFDLPSTQQEVREKQLLKALQTWSAAPNTEAYAAKNKGLTVRRARLGSCMGSWEPSELATLQPSLAIGNSYGLHPFAPLPSAAGDTDTLQTVKALPVIARWVAGLFDSRREPTTYAQADESSDTLPFQGCPIRDLELGVPLVIGSCSNVDLVLQLERLLTVLVSQVRTGRTSLALENIETHLCDYAVHRAISDCCWQSQLPQKWAHAKVCHTHEVCIIITYPMRQSITTKSPCFKQVVLAGSPRKICTSNNTDV